VGNLSDAVRIMGKVQKNKEFTEEEINNIVAYLKTLTGEYKGKPVTQLTNQDVR
jgi:cytochrome c peroxidase